MNNKFSIFLPFLLSWEILLFSSVWFSNHPQRSHKYFQNKSVCFQPPADGRDREVTPSCSIILISLSSLSSFSFVPLSARQIAGGILKYPPLPACPHTNFEMRLMIKFVNYLFVKNFVTFSLVFNQSLAWLVQVVFQLQGGYHHCHHPVDNH